MRGGRSLEGLAIAVALFAMAGPARADDIFDLAGYVDLRAIAPASDRSWLKGGLGKFRYGHGDGNVQFAEAVGQLTAHVDDDWKLVVVGRAEPGTDPFLDAEEAYAAWTPATSGDLGWSVKAGAFFPTISLENDDLGWTSPYTLTPSAIDSWIGEELRTIGAEARVKWQTAIGSLTATAALTSANDEAGILMADRGWAMDDRPTGLFGRVRLPDATIRLFRATPPVTTGMFDEIDGRVGWYAGAQWQMAGIGKLTVLRYDNNGDPSDKTGLGDTSWATRFWSFGGRTSVGPVLLIAQGLTGMTSVTSRGAQSLTDFQSAYLLASYGLDDLGLADFRASLRGDVFQTRRVQATPSAFSEDGHAITASLSWQGLACLRLTGEVIVLDSRKLEYLSAGLPSADRSDTQVQFSARFFL